jgi:hypothetical protein
VGVIFDPEKRWDVNTFEPGKPLQQCFFGFLFLAGGNDLPANLQDDFLPIPQDERVKKVSQWLRVHNTRAASDDQRVFLSAICGPEGDPG